MGLFLHTILFPGGEEAACRAALLLEAGDPELSFLPDKPFRVEDCRWRLYEKGPAVLLADGCNGYELAGRLSGSRDRVLECPVMLLYIYDDDFWGYELWQRGRQLDQFASLPGYFDEDSPPNKPGDAGIVARCFGVDPGRIQRYLLPWNEAREGVRAYESDQAAAGDSWQMADFMAALGFDFDLLCPPEEPEGEKLEKEPNGPVREPVSEPVFQSARGREVVDNTPILPNVLTSRAYALQRLEALGKDYQGLSPLLQYAKYQEAVALLEEAIQAHPDEAGLYLLRAFCWKQLEDLRGRSRKMELNRDLAKALELEPDNIMALRGRCSLTTTSARYPRQIQDLTRLMELDAENQDLHQVSRAYFHHWLKDDTAARADLEAVLDRGKLWTVDLVYLCKELKLPGFAT